MPLVKTGNFNYDFVVEKLAGAPGGTVPSSTVEQIVEWRSNSIKNAPDMPYDAYGAAPGLGFPDLATKRTLDDLQGSVQDTRDQTVAAMADAHKAGVVSNKAYTWFETKGVAKLDATLSAVLGRIEAARAHVASDPCD